MNKKLNKKIGALIAAIMVVSLIAAIAPTVSAAPVGDNEYTQNVGTPVTNATIGTTVSARGGNITPVNFSDVMSQTSKWQGFYGNLSGTIVLGSSTGTMKSWVWSNETANNISYVLATTNSSIPYWWGLTPAITTDIDTAWQFTTTDQDSATNTFNDATGSELIIAGKHHTALASSQADTYNSNASANKWYTVALDNGSSPSASSIDPFVFVGINNVSSSATAYNNVQCDYQMIVPVYHYGGEPSNNYYFYVELR